MEHDELYRKLHKIENLADEIATESEDGAIIALSETIADAAFKARRILVDE